MSLVVSAGEARAPSSHDSIASRAPRTVYSRGVRAFLLSIAAAALILVAVVRPLVARTGRSAMNVRARLLATSAGIVYGLLGRFSFGISYANWGSAFPEWIVASFGVMSVSFLFLIPLVIGILDQTAPVTGSTPVRRP